MTDFSHWWSVELNYPIDIQRNLTATCIGENAAHKTATRVSFYMCQ